MPARPTPPANRHGPVPQTPEERKHATEAATQYWIRTEIPRIPHLANLCRTNEDSYIKAEPQWF